MSSDLKKEKYMCRVRKEFNLANDERWVITKLRMKLVRMDVCIVILKIRESQNIKKDKANLDVQESTRNNILYKAHEAIKREK